MFKYQRVSINLAYPMRKISHITVEKGTRIEAYIFCLSWCPWDIRAIIICIANASDNIENLRFYDYYHMCNFSF